MMKMNCNIKVFLFMLFMANGVTMLHAQYRFDNILYGAAYYHEYMPSERLDEDVRLMKEYGVNVVRVGESSWGIFEPQEGVFKFEWMDRILDKMHEAGIKVVLGTPTYSIPAWMAERHPEVLAQYPGGGQAYYGIRQNMNFMNPTYRFYSERIIRKLMERYAKHPAIIGYQVDNEIEARNINNHDYFVGFRNYVKNKFKGNINKLTKEWVMNYWGMNIHRWEDFYPRDGVTNPSYKNEWERWNRKAIADFLNWQVDIVNEYKQKNQFVTHCFMGAFQNVDQVESFRQMEYPANNVYHNVQDGQDGQLLAYVGDFMRTVAKGNYLITETNAQTTGWDSRNQYPPYDGQLRQNVYGHLASGANMVEYWHWSSIHYGQETYWKGILGHDLEGNRISEEFKKVAGELRRIGTHLVNLKKRNKAAILFSHDSYHALQFMPYSWKDNYPIHKVYGALYRQNIETDIIPCDQIQDFDDYQFLVIPPLYVATDSLLDKISNFVYKGGEVVMLYKSGFCNEYSAVRPQKAPGPLRKACGFYYQEFSSIRGMALKSEAFSLNNPVAVDEWYEFLVPETAEPLACADHPFFGRWPVVTKNSFGRGHLFYIGAVPSDELLEKIVRMAAGNAGILSEANEYRFPLIIRSGVNDMGRLVHYIFNYSGIGRGINYMFDDGKELLSGKIVRKRDFLEISPWGCAIIEDL